MSTQTIRIEIDSNMLEAIKHLLKTVDYENRRSRFTLSPGKEIQKAFGVDITKIITMQTEKSS